jgi:hypothetical protein
MPGLAGTVLVYLYKLCRVLFAFVLLPIIGKEFLRLDLKLLVADSRQTAFDVVLVDDPSSQLVDPDFVNAVVTLQAKELVDPVRDAVGAAFIRDGDPWRPV